MKTLNRVDLTGNVGQDPVIRKTNTGKLIANFSIATSDNYKDKKTGEWVDHTDWHRVVVFDALAEIAERIKKGDMVSVIGQLKTRKWDQNGVERYTTEVVVKGFDGMLHILAKPEKLEGAQKILNGNVEEDEEIPF